MSLFIIGSNGQIGWELTRQCAALGLPHKSLDLPDIDITQPESILKGLGAETEMVVNAAAYTAVDRAETDSDSAYAVNEKGPGSLAAVCAQKRIPLIHISTDYVFDGTKTGPYIETDPVAPLGIYGKSKAAGETAVRSRLDEHLILRTAWLCGVHGQNFVKTMLRLGSERETIQVVADQKGCPTFAFDIAEAILAVFQKYLAGESIAWGTYHYCGKGPTTWHGFALEIFNCANRLTRLKVRNINPISTADYPTPAKRPSNSVLDCSKIQANLEIETKPWQPRLKHMLEQLFR